MKNDVRLLLEKHFDTAFAAPDGIKKLRELILTLAMQGKLVAQDPNDPPASELLKEIEAEKKRLTRRREGAKGKSGKTKELPSIKPDEEFPEGWEWVKLDDVSLKIHYGYTASANHNTQNVRLLRITDIQDNRVDWETVPGCNAKKEDVSQYLLVDNDILIARTGGTIGKSYLVQGISVDAVFASYLIRVVPSHHVYVRFLKYFVESPIYWKQLYSACSGTGQPNVNGTSLSQLRLALPPLMEQRRIVARTDQLMARCDELEKLRAEREQLRLSVHTAAIQQLLEEAATASFASSRLRVSDFLFTHFDDLYTVKENVAELRKAILQLAVMGKLVPQDPNEPPASELLNAIDAKRKRVVKTKKIKQQKLTPAISPNEVPFAVPEKWKWVRISRVTESIDYGTSQKTCNDSTLVPVYRMGNIVNGKLVNDGFKYISPNIDELPRLYLKSNDILFNRTNSYELVGKSALYSGADKHATFASYLIRIRLIEKQLLPAFFSLAMNAPYFRATQIEPEIVQQCGQANFNGTKLSLCLVPLPPLDEQHRIVAKVDKLMALCDTVEQQIDATTGKRTDLLNTLMDRV